MFRLFPGLAWALLCAAGRRHLCVTITMVCRVCRHSHNAVSRTIQLQFGILQRQSIWILPMSTLSSTGHNVTRCSLALSHTHMR